MRHILAEDNLGLLAKRQSKRDPFSYIWCTNSIVEGCVFESAYANNTLFPLYLTDMKVDSLAINKQTIQRKNCRPNLSQEFLNALTKKLGYIPTPEAIFYYIYAVLHSPTYRTRYAEFLKIDFPRVPLTSNDELFCQLADYGEQLIQLHLMTSPKSDNLITEFVEATGNRTVDPGHPKYDRGVVIINKKGDKFTGVPEEVWNFYVGGYQPCQKWLKDSKGSTLSDEDILHYQKIVISLKETIELMAKIDEAIPGFPIE